MRKEFERVSPESVGLCSQAILDYINALEDSGTEMHGIMIMRHGKICTEGWWSPFAPNVRHGLQSHTKTYAATAVGIANTQGVLRLDERIIDIFPEDAPENPSENLQLLTVRDVLCMGCGMDEMPHNTENWIRDFLHIPVTNKPGTTYMYNSTGSTLLGAIVRKKTGLGLHDYLCQHLFAKIGINPENLRWICMDDGMEMGGGGLFATTEDNLRLMKLYADGGVWEGERILSEEYVALATSLQNESATEAKGNPSATDNFLGYGFQVWMCKPEGVYRADGAMGQFTIVCPKQDMLISITETAMGAHWAQSTLDVTWNYLEKVVSDEVMPETEATRLLAKKMQSVCLPHPNYKPFSPTIANVSGKKYAVSEGNLHFDFMNFMNPIVPPCAESFTLDFDDYGCVLSLNMPNEKQSARIATNGTRFTNMVGKVEDTKQMLLCDGAWEDEKIFVVNLRWLETCFTKTLKFCFEADSVTIIDGTNGMSPRGPFTPKNIVAKQV